MEEVIIRDFLMWVAKRVKDAALFNRTHALLQYLENCMVGLPKYMLGLALFPMTDGSVSKPNAGTYYSTPPSQ